MTVSEKDQVVNTSFTNTYTRDTGTFSIAKSVQGGPEGAANGSYSFTYTCDGGVQGNPDGPPVTGRPCPPRRSRPGLLHDRGGRRVGRQGRVLGGLGPVTGLGDHHQGPDRGRHRHQHLHPRHRHLLGHQECHGRLRPAGGDAVKVGYTCNDPEGTKGTLDVPMDGTAVGGRPSPRGRCAP